MVNVQKFLVLFLFGLIIFSCNRDVLEEVNCESIITPVYEGEVQNIINLSCAYVGCHSSGFGNGDYSTYNNILGTNLDKFVAEISNGEMPPSYASDGPKTLTAGELLTLQCWAQGGYLEN